MAEKDKFLDKDGLTYYDAAQKQRFLDIRELIEQTSSESKGGGSNSFYISIKCSEEYEGATFTATSELDSSTYSAVAKDGKALIEVLRPGKYHVTNTFNEDTGNVTVGDPFIDEIQFSAFKATITVTIPSELIGYDITCSQGSTTLTQKANSTTVSFTVAKLGQWTIGVKDNSYITAEVTVNDSQFSYNSSLNISGGGIPIINVTLSDKLIGETITCTKGSVSYKKVAATTSLQFILNELGEWTVAVEGNSFITQKVNVQNAQAYSVALDITDTGVPMITAKAKSEDNGKTLKCVKDSTILTKIITNKTATFILPETGNWKLTCDDYGSSKDKTVNVAEAKNYTVAYNAEIFGVEISTDSNSNTRVTYTDDAIGMTPAKMESNSFNWGSWKDIFFNAENHVYRMNTAGERVGQVKDDNYAQYVTGGDSGVTGSGNTDNFMASMPTVWVYRGMNGNKAFIKISEVQVDSNYKAYAHTDASGNVLDYIYWPAFRGSEVGGRMRSISGQPLMASKTAQQEIDLAVANGTKWYTFDWADWNLRNDLLTIMFKTTNLQSALGKGHSTGNNATLNTGSLITKGAFWGDQTGTNEVKAFHCEAPWGNQYLRIAGCVTSGATMKVKMTRPYNTTGSGYITVSPAAATQSGWWSTRNTNEYGTWPTAVAGSDSTYEADYFYNNTTDAYAYVGGDWLNDLGCGPFYLRVSYAASSTLTHFGSALSLK